jgi:hypothetical protein
MKFVLVMMMALLSQSVFAASLVTSYSILMKCGKVEKVKCAKPLKRLEPGLFGINQKYVIKTKFYNGQGYAISSSDEGHYTQVEYTVPKMNKAFTYFSLKKKFKTILNDFKTEFKRAKEDGRDLYACEGYINVTPLRYKGSHIYYSYESIEDAKAKMIRKAEQHL